MDRAPDHSLGTCTQHSHANLDGYDDAYTYDNCDADGYAYIHAHRNAHVDPYSIECSRREPHEWAKTTRYPPRVLHMPLPEYQRACQVEAV